MGHGKWSASAYTTYSNTAKTMSGDDLYHRKNKFDNVKSGQAINIEEIKFRESRDSDEHPVTTPIMVALDVTGSMGIIPEHLTKDGLGVFVNQMLQNNIVASPHLLFMGIGDAVARDRAPLQATQFESDNRICDQLTDIWLEGCGGGNNFESYDLAWAFGAFKTQTDAWEKRKEKGFLFTVGDELFPSSTAISYFNSVFGNDNLSDPTPAKLLEKAQEKWNVFHIIIEQGSYVRGHGLNTVVSSWKQHLQKRAISLSDYNYLPHLLISIVALESGQSPDDVLEMWGQNIQSVIRKSLEL